MKKLGFIGNPASLQRESRDNTGNIIHGEAARSLFTNATNVRSQPADENIEQIRNNISHLGFVAATMLHTRKPPKYIDGHTQAANFIEKLDLPVCAFGFGCHAYLDDTIAAANVDERSLRLLKVIAERSKTVGVRGEFTADLCAKYGVKNVTVVGCQSAYVAGLLNHQQKNLPTIGNRSVCYVSIGPDERETQRLAMSGNADMIGQGNETEERIVAGSIARADFIANTENYYVFPYLVKMFKEKALSRGAYYDYVATHFHKFYTVPEWRAHIRSNYDFCFGTRFHGNMAAFQAGVPALWLIHDMRTKELCEHLKLPAMPMEKLKNINTIEELKAHCDYAEYWKALPQKTSEFLEYLDGNGIKSFLRPQVANDFQSIINES